MHANVIFILHFEPIKLNSIYNAVYMIYYFYEFAFMCAIIDKKLCSIAFVTCRNYIDEDCIVRFGYNTSC